EKETVGAARRPAPGIETAGLAPRERVEAAVGRGSGEQDDPEQRDAEPERRQDEVLPPRLERVASPAEADEQRRGGGRRLDEEPRAAEVSDERHRDEHRPEREQEPVEEA